MERVPRIGLGCMRLSTLPDRDRRRGIATVHAALDAGVRLLDTSDAYCLDHADVGHNERLIRDALQSWSGDVGEVVVATKGGLTRPRGNWVPDGRGKHLKAACAASLVALGVDQIELYQLHTLDPKTKISTSVRALAKLQKDGLIRHIGLCNVRVHEVEEALQHARIASVQVSFGPYDDTAIRNGLLEFCANNHIAFIAHSPMGGYRRRRRKSPYTRAQMLGWTASLGAIPIPGARSPEHATINAVLDDPDPAMDASYPAAQWMRNRPSPPSADADGEVTILMGMPASGKTSAVLPWVDRGYFRLNRDKRGGTLAALLPLLDEGLASGKRHAVLDNTYPQRSKRNRIVEIAWRHGIPVRCVWLQTTLEEAQRNACERMIGRYGRLLTPAEMKKSAGVDPNSFPPRVLHHYLRELEAPREDEGFACVDRIPFTRFEPPGSGSAILLDLDAVRPTEAAKSRLLAYDGIALGMTWIPKGDPDAAAEAARATWGVDMDVETCVHPPGAPICWCRRPLPGIGVVFTHRHGLDPAKVTVIGDSTSNKGFARRCGFAITSVESWN